MVADICNAKLWVMLELATTGDAPSGALSDFCLVVLWLMMYAKWRVIMWRVYDITLSLGSNQRIGL
jgi:hypothetical protein